jgi:hypothetical protein
MSHTTEAAEIAARIEAAAAATVAALQAAIDRADARAAAIRHAVRILHADPFQLHHPVRLSAVGTLCALADLGFPALADLMSDPVRASVGAYRAEIRDAFTYSDCVGCTPQHMCSTCDAEERRAMRLAERAYSLTA